jgi:hypothetical protein
MPAPQAAMMKNLAKLAFKAHAIKLPVGWQQPSGEEGKQYSKAFKQSELFAPPDPSKLFIPASSNKYHVDTVKQMSDKFEKYIDGICDAICQAWSSMHSAATLVGVIVNAVTASGGTLVAMPMTPLILGSGPKASPAEAKFTTTISNVVGMAFSQWALSVKVPGLPWYPAFAAFPSPVAPPMPNVPIPLVALTQVNASLQDAAMKGQMCGQHGDPQAQHHKELFDCVAKAVAQCFTIYTATTLVNNVLGTGPIPTFAPPYVPVGPVVGGVANQIPGGMT